MARPNNILLFAFLCIITAFFCTSNPAVLYAQPAEVNAADYGFNAADATAALQAAINTGAQKVIVQNMGTDWIVNQTIWLVSNQEVFFEPGVIVTAKKGEFHNLTERLFGATKKSNITLSGYGATLRMQKNDYLSAEYAHSEWRHVLSFIDCNDITIKGLTLRDSGGDGIYLGSTVGASEIANWCNNIYIKDVVSDNNNRQGISVISAQNLLIEDSSFLNTAGTPPEAGIDFEPNNSYQKLVNCTVRNCTFQNNYMGISIYLIKLTADAPPVTILLENCTVSSGSDTYSVLVADLGDLHSSGSIEFKNCTFNAGSFNIYIKDKNPLGPPLIFRDCVMKNVPNRPIAFTLERLEVTTINGGVEFDNCVINYANSKPCITAFSGPTTDISGTLHVFNPLGTSMSFSGESSNISVAVNEYTHTLPYISSVTISPNSGTVGIGDTVVITATSITPESGLTPSAATINGRQVPLASQGGGIYRGTYTVQAGDAEGVNIEAANITLTDGAKVSPPASSSGSTLSVSTEPEQQEPPTISSVVLSPNSGSAKVDDAIVITVTAGNNEAGLTPSTATINGRQISLTDQGNGTYTGTYTVAEGDPDASNVEASGITLTGAGGTSAPASSTGSTLTVDGHRPVISSVTLSPNSGTITTGGNITVTVTASGAESGLTPSGASLLGHTIPLTDQLNGSYTGSYTVQASDKAESFSADALFSDGFESGNTNGWSSVDAGISVTSDARYGDYGVSYNVVSTDNKSMLKQLSADYPETYTSFYFKMDDDFSMVDGDVIYISLMMDSDDNYAWAMKLQRSGSSYQLTEYLGGWITQVGTWTTINHNQWYWIKVHHDSDVNGTTEWWLDGVRQGIYTGDTSGSRSGSYRGVFLFGIDAGTSGSINYDHFQITPTDHSQAAFIEAANITLADAAGNVSAPAASSGSTLTIEAEPPPPEPPTISSVVISPMSGTITIGDAVAITVTAGNNETGLTPSAATINSRQVPLSGQGDGTYTGTYVVAEGDNSATNVEAANITLTGDGGTSAPAASSGSTLTIDAEPPPPEVPTVSSVVIAPQSGFAKVGDTVVITVTAGNNEVGLTPSAATINGRQVLLSGQGDGTYTGTYVVAEGDNSAANVEATNITLTGDTGTSLPASSQGSTLIVDAQTPTITSIELQPPASNTAGLGQGIYILVRAGGNETGLIPSPATINNRQVQLSDNGDGTYGGFYIVGTDDDYNTNVVATNVTLTDIAGNVSLPASSEDTGVTVDPSPPVIDPQIPVLESVTISPSSGWITTGDTVTITVKSASPEENLTPSNASINGTEVTLSQSEPGTFTGTYTVAADDNQGKNIEAMSITLTDPDGNVSNPAASTGSTLQVDTMPPGIASVSLVPSDDTILGYGESVAIVVAAVNNETGLTASSALINTKNIPLIDQGDGTYRGVYYPMADDPQGVAIEAENITLTDPAGNSSLPASSTGSGITVDIDEGADILVSDFNTDGNVDFIDFSMFVTHYGERKNDANWDSTYDIIPDGKIDFPDFDAFSGSYGYTSGGAAKTAISMPEDAVICTYEMATVASEMMNYITISFDDISNMTGFELLLSYDPLSLELVSRSVSGPVGLTISQYGDGVIRIASMFNEQPFDGTVTVGFKYQDIANAANVGITQVQVAENGGVIITPELRNGGMFIAGRIPGINDLSITKTSETFVDLSWTAPASSDGSTPVSRYQIEIGHQAPDENGWNAATKSDPGITPLLPGNAEQFRVSGLQPGYPYYFSVRSVDQESFISDHSNIVSTTTMAKFIDEDLDPEDPYIVRDSDSLFVADNDNSLTFIWSSWDIMGVNAYQIKVGAGGNTNIIATETVRDTMFVFVGEAGETYQLEITPVIPKGEPQGTILSRAILCSPGFIDKPGKPTKVKK